MDTSLEKGKALDLFSMVRDVARCLKLPLVLYIVLANSKGSGKTALMRRLACLRLRYLHQRKVLFPHEQAQLISVV